MNFLSEIPSGAQLGVLLREYWYHYNKGFQALSLWNWRGFFANQPNFFRIKETKTVQECSDEYFI